jgi:hypothetical protein
MKEPNFADLLAEEMPGRTIDDAAGVVDVCMRASVRRIDKAFGDGYAKANPALLAKFMELCEAEYSGRGHSASVGQIADAISGLSFPDFENVATAIQNIAAMIDYSMTPLRVQVSEDK